LKIKDICEVFDGPHATPAKTETGPYYLSISSLEKGALLLDRSAHLSESDFVKWTRRVTPAKGDLLFSYETRLGESALVPAGLKACLGRRMGILRPDQTKVIPAFLLYAYMSPEFQSTIKKNTITGATVDRISLTELPDFEIKIPPLSEQVKISHFLSAIDAKIELNNRINAELEGMAKLLYDYWFVQFDFPMTATQAAALGNPKLEGKPYRTSGGKMIYNETLKRNIPEGWKNSSVKDYTPVLTGKEDANHATICGEFHFFTCGEQSLRCDDFKFEGKAVLVAGNGNFSVKFFDGRFNAYQRTYVLLPRDEAHFALIYFAIFDAIKGLTKGSQGSIIKFLTKGNIEDVALPLPSQSGKEVFWHSINTILLTILVNRKQNEELTQLRDWLLPMLMNGQITVN
jgi:type I restriction enzyme S subunit